MVRSNTMEEKLEVVDHPLESDVLCGKNKECLDHPGSRAFRSVIEQYTTQYQQADSKYMKMEITKQIYERLREQCSRFLKYNPKSKRWQELKSSHVRDKIGHSLRFSLSKKSRQSKHKRSNSEMSTDSGSSPTVASETASYSSDADSSKRSRMDDEYRPVTRLLRSLNTSFRQIPRSVSFSSDGMLPGADVDQIEGKLTDRDVISMLREPLMEFEPQAVKSLHSFS